MQAAVDKHTEEALAGRRSAFILHAFKGEIFEDLSGTHIPVWELGTAVRTTSPYHHRSGPFPDADHDERHAAPTGSFPTSHLTEDEK